MTTPRTRLDNLRITAARYAMLRQEPIVSTGTLRDLLALVEAAVAWRDSMQLKGGSLFPLSDVLEKEAAKWTQPA